MGSPSGTDGAKLWEEAPETAPRRSSRRVAPRKLSTSTEDQNAASTKSVPGVSETRRNPKRKASEATQLNVGVPDELLGEALRPLASQDIEEWEGWVELESEPAFFSTILRDLGVRDVKAHELFGIDQVSLDLLPKPVFGLIFLFEYIPDVDETSEDEDPVDLWFANQTTNNACATVALLNIVMNAPDIGLGDKLRDFKEQTRDLCTPLRGHYLSSNTFIRTIHNSFTRRMDHLNADLFLENEASAASAKNKRRATPKKGARKRKTQNSGLEYGFHFVAYVPAHGHVWELDGLKMKPQKIGPLESQDWTTVAQPHIQARMLQYAETQLAFNLLALCQSPLVSCSRAIAGAVASLRHLHTQMQSQPAFSDLVSAESSVLDINNASQLSEFQLNKSDIETAVVSQSLKDSIASTDFGVQQALKEHHELTREVKVAMGEYRAEMMSIAADELKVQGRKKDYAPALHRWMTKLAEKGLLEEAIRRST